MWSRRPTDDVAFHAVRVRVDVGMQWWMDVWRAVLSALVSSLHVHTRRVFHCLFLRHSLGLSIGAALDRWRVIEPEVARRIPSGSLSATVRGFLVLLTQKISLLPLPP